MRASLVCLVVVATLALAKRGNSPIPPRTGPLYEYVNTPDPHYSWFDTGVRINANNTGWTGYLLNMTSQQWMTPGQVSRSVWTHQLVVIVPHELVNPSFGLLYITGGGNDNPSPPAPNDEDVLIPATIAMRTGTIAATLFQIPNAPIVFADDPKHEQRSEDAMVAFTWLEYMGHQDVPEWIAYFPMTKASVRALDTVQAYVSNEGIAKVEQFLVAGASKRGWTTWMVGTLSDPRVVGIAPIVMDLLNLEPNIQHMYENYGGWTFAFQDYYALNITSQFGTENMTALAQWIDPLNYAESLTMPKLVIDSTGDEFFQPDDDWFWWGQLPGETYRLMVQNAEHSMATGVFEVVTGIDAFVWAIIDNAPRPQFNWTIDQQTGAITVVSQSEPTRAIMHYATTFDNKRRDFRLVKGNTPADPCTFIPVHIFGNACINPVFWIGEELGLVSTAGGVYTYVATQDMPQDGKWRAFFVELEFPGPHDTSYRITTQVSVIPNTRPFPACTSQPQGCYGVLV